jgi:hypothetical protein
MAGSAERQRALGLAGTVLAVAVASPLADAARRDDAPTADQPAICAFLQTTLQTLFRVGTEVDLTMERSATAGAPAAARGLRKAAGALKAEGRRVGKTGRAHLGRTGRKALKRALTVARGAVRKAARAARRRRSDTLAARLDRASTGIGALLGEQTAAHRDLACGPVELRVARLHVPAGATRSVPGGATIVAETGIELLGTLVVDGSSADGITLVAESGDVVLEGGIDASGRAGIAPLAGARLATTAAAGPAGQSCGDGGAVSIEPRAGNIIVGGSHFAIAGDGTSCGPLTVSQISELRVVNAPLGVYELPVTGGRGGDVILSAPQGTIRFRPRVAGDPPPFSPGAGGDGAALGVAPTFAPPPGFKYLGLRAGAGGWSGGVRLAAPTVELGTVTQLYRQGRGGRGGDAYWDNGPGTQLFPSGLEIVLLGGGAGGAGAIEAGRGGDATYLGDRVVNAVGDAITSARTVGGLGGDVLADPTYAIGGEDFFEGGRGGDARTVGHRGWNGDATHPDGSPGGDTAATGGPGGLFERSSVVIAGNDRGGAGGDARATSGAGGDGWANCGQTGELLGPGGKGGDSGPLTVAGGRGVRAVGGTGGNGGSALEAVLGQPGRGGQGAPPGECGADAPADVTAGAGGAGVIPGDEGIAVIVTLRGCEPEPLPCMSSTTTTLPGGTCTLAPEDPTAVQCADACCFDGATCHITPHAPICCDVGTTVCGGAQGDVPTCCGSNGDVMVDPNNPSITGGVCCPGGPPVPRYGSYSICCHTGQTCCQRGSCCDAGETCCPGAVSGACCGPMSSVCCQGTGVFEGLSWCCLNGQVCRPEGGPAGGGCHAPP